MILLNPNLSRVFTICGQMLARCLCRGTSTSLPSSSFHTSAVAYKAPKLSKKARDELKAERIRKAKFTKPSVVLGTRPGDEAKWLNCDLARVLVKEEELRPESSSTTPVELPLPSGGQVDVPNNLLFGIGETEKRKLFQALPTLSLRTLTASAWNETTAEKRATVPEQGEFLKTGIFARLVDLRNANAKGVAYENRRRIILAFSGPENAYDPGRTEVQVAILTYRIRNIWAHMNANKRDVNNRKNLAKLVHQRGKLLRYLKRTQRVRYDILLERLGLEPESVEGELIVN